MLRKLKLLRRSSQDAKRFQALSQDERRIVFYSEDTASWVFFEDAIQDLTGRLGRSICYLTSAPDDPILETTDPQIRSFFISEGAVRTTLFMNLRADLLVMTMPDLEQLYVKRSKVYPVHYAYIFHSINSTQMVYRKGAFDHYDTLFCVGPHHVREIRETERVYSLEPKELIEHGYGRLDSLLRERSEHSPEPRSEGSARRVLVAPSWGPGGLLETLGVEITQVLLDAGYFVTVRPHPASVKLWPKKMQEIEETFEGHPAFVFETDISTKASLYEADAMVSDWSGAAWEFAFVLERPVLYIDVAHKIVNPDYQDISLPPMEAQIRTRIGELLSPSELDRAPEAIERLIADPAMYREQIDMLRKETVFNVGDSGRVAADQLARLADAQIARNEPG